MDTYDISIAHIQNEIFSHKTHKKKYVSVSDNQTLNSLDSTIQEVPNDNIVSINKKKSSHNKFSKHIPVLFLKTPDDSNKKKIYKTETDTTIKSEINQKPPKSSSDIMGRNRLSKSEPTIVSSVKAESSLKPNNSTTDDEQDFSFSSRKSWSIGEQSPKISPKKSPKKSPNKSPKSTESSPKSSESSPRHRKISAKSSPKLSPKSSSYSSSHSSPRSSYSSPRKYNN